MFRTLITTILLIVVFINSPSCADITEFDEDFDGWQSASGDFTFIDFTGFEDGEIITDQLADLGVTFPEGDDFAFEHPLFLDNWGLVDTESGLPEPDNIWVEFEQPMTAIAVDFTSIIQFELFNDGESIYLSNNFSAVNTVEFTGLLSDQPFDSVRLENRGSSTPAIDNLYFGPPIPAPGVLGLFAFGSMAFGLRRRRK